MKRRILIIALICSLLLNSLLGVLLIKNSRDNKDRFFYSAAACRGWFSTYLEYYQNGYSTEEPRIRAIASLESMAELARIIDKNDAHALTLSFFIDMLIANPQSFEQNLAEIVEIMDLLAKNFSDQNAYKKIDLLLDGFKG